MKVYCCLNENDIKNIENGKMNEVGHEPSLVFDPDSDHARIAGEKYVRFTRRKENFNHIRSNGNGDYVARFNIPIKLLLENAGRTYYEYGTIYDEKVDSVVEYLIKSKELKKEYFKNVVKAKGLTNDEIVKTLKPTIKEVQPEK